MTQLALLAERRFSPYFVTQFLGVLNDSLFRHALVILIVTRATTLGDLSTEATMILAAGAYVLPYLVLSAWAGRLADTMSKTLLIRRLKALELLVMGVATLALSIERLDLLLVVLTAMSAQSALFEPVKFSVLPDLLARRQLTGGNALVIAGTFLGILIGTVAANRAAGQPTWLVGVAAVVIALLGIASSRWIPETSVPAEDPGTEVYGVGVVRQTARAVRLNRTVFLSVLGVSWFWFVGASFVTLLPSFGKEVLGANETIVEMFLAVFCGGVAIGALLCEWFGGRKLELGLVPIGSIGLAVVAADLYFASSSLHHIGEELVGLDAFLRSEGSTRLIVDFALLAVFSGLFIVPLYALMEMRSKPSLRSRVMAGNSVLNTSLIVLSWAMLAVLPKLGISIPGTFLLLAVLSALVSAYIYTVIPEFLLRLIAWFLAKVMYRVRVVGDENLPDDGPTVVAANHVTYVDWLIIFSVYQRPLRFVMHEQFLKLPLVGWAFRDAKVIPIASARENPDTVRRAFDRIAAELEDDNAVCIFPEGELTYDGKLGSLKPGIERIVERTPATIVPVRLDGLWGSFFSRKDGQALKKPFRRVWSRITLTVHPPIPPEGFVVEDLKPLIGP